MGRPRTPTALKLVKGTAQPCRTNKSEPKPKRAIPSPPEHLSDRAKTAWGYVAAILDRMHVLTEADALVLEGLCATYAELCDARAALKLRGATTYEGLTQNGSIWRQYPEVAQVSDLDRRFHAWLTKLGLTPADRSKVSAIGEKDEADPWANL